MPPAMQAAIQNPPFRISVTASVYQRPFPRPASFSAPFAWVGSEQLTVSPLPVESGSITIDNSGAQRRIASLTVTPTDAILPVSVASALTPFRNMVLLYYNVVGLDPVAYPASSILLGIFTLTDVTASAPSSGDRTMTLDLQDLSQDISRRVLTKTYVTPNGTSMTQAARQLMESAAPGVIPWFQADSTSAITSGSDSAPDQPNAAGYTWDPGQDPWEAGQEMGQAIGMQLYFTPTGVCVMSYLPNPAATPPCWAYSQGSGSPWGPPNITAISRTFSQSQVYNFIQMIVESANSNPSPDLLYTGTSFLAQVGDTDPSSPTNMDGPFGQVADVFYDQFNYQSGPALIAAKTLLRQGLGAADVVKFDALPNPAHECYDRIHVYSDRLGLIQDYIVDTVELPLTPGKDMSITARRVVNVP
ncbi:MAG TPA: hypothetical protein VMW80_14315 [Candidatus Dormibacteraeota bacterium]|nr:hypothetical protein [Candidatus Dormibacteraeota bacterium]